MDEYKILMEGRKTLLIGGVTDVIAFSEDHAEIETALGSLQISGHTLHMDRLDLEKKEAHLSGQIDSLWYPDSAGDEKKGFFSRLFAK